MQCLTAVQPAVLRDHGALRLRLHVVLALLLVELALFLGRRVLVLLVLADEIVHVALRFGELHLILVVFHRPSSRRSSSVLLFSDPENSFFSTFRQDIPLFQFVLTEIFKKTEHECTWIYILKALQMMRMKVSGILNHLYGS